MYRNTGAPHDDLNLQAEWDRPDVGESESVPDTESLLSATTDNADVEAGQLAIVRHGESTANKMGEFSGWGNHGLTDQGEQDAHEAAKHLVAKGMRFDEVHTSVLSRTLRTANIICEYIGYSFQLHTTCLHFDDLHDTGLYTWDYLYELGTLREARWQTYLEAIESKGLSRDP